MDSRGADAEVPVANDGLVEDLPFVLHACVQHIVNGEEACSSRLSLLSKLLRAQNASVLGPELPRLGDN